MTQYNPPAPKALNAQRANVRQKDNKPAQPVALSLAPEHLQKLRGSGLTDKTIADAGLYTANDPVQLGRLLGGLPCRSIIPALIFPFRGLDGRLINDYAVARPTTPRVTQSDDGKPRLVKYEAPAKRGCRAYFPPDALKAINTPGGLLLITEGILKALASTQAGVPCIGLMGVWNWVVGGSRPMRLIDDLAAIDWRGRQVVIVFDFDTARNPSVNQAATELARALAGVGAYVRLPSLPPGPLDDNQRPTKQGLDDFIVNVGEAAFRRWLAEQLAEPPVQTINDRRREIIAARHESLGQPGVRLDRSPPGTGKSYADLEAAQALGDRRSLSLQPTHVNCQQVESDLRGRGLNAAAFPPLKADTCQKSIEAHALEAQGLSHARVLCPACEFKRSCKYLLNYKRAHDAQHAVATHKRGELKMSTLTEDRSYVAIHEDPLAIFCPAYTVREGEGGVDLWKLEGIANKAADSAEHEEAERYYRRLGEVARELRGCLDGTNETSVVPLPWWIQYVPATVDLDLYTASQRINVKPERNALWLTRAATEGRLDTLNVKVDEFRGDRGEIKLIRSLCGFLKATVPSTATVWINDATADKQQLIAALGQPVEDCTPTGRLERLQPCLQVPTDVTIGTKPEKAASILRELLTRLPYQRVGVITHKALSSKLRALLGEPMRSRIAMVEHFRSGHSRGSNEWLEKCDALVVLGTPRVPTTAVRERLLQLGDVQSAALNQEQAGWGPDWWSGVTESGKRVSVKARAYRDHAWHAAYCALVRSELNQSVGRGRSHLENGLPTYVVTVEYLGPPDQIDGQLGLPLLDGWEPGKSAPLTTTQQRVVAALYRRNGGHWIRVRATTEELKEALEFSEQRTRAVLTELVALGKVRKIGERGGWAAVGPFNATPALNKCFSGA